MARKLTEARREQNRRAARVFKLKKKIAGFNQSNVWARENALADLQLQAELLARDPDLKVGDVKSRRTGRVVAKKAILKKEVP